VIIGEEDTGPHHRDILFRWVGSAIGGVFVRRKSEISAMFFTTFKFAELRHKKRLAQPR
jgi:hypothetical protein